MTYEEMVEEHTSQFHLERLERLLVPGIYADMYQMNIEPSIIPELTIGMEMMTLSV